MLDLWPQGKVAFGVYAPSEAERGKPPVYTPDGAAKVAANPLYDYVFLNLEGAYDAAAVKAYGEGLKKSSRKTLIVRIPPISKDGADATRARVKEILDAGADGVTIPHIRDIDEAKLALSFFTAAKANVWSPKNPKGTKLAMLMLEDPKAIEQRKEIADLPGISILACGIGSLAQAHRRRSRGRPRRCGSRHAAGARRNQARQDREHADRQRQGRRAARQGRLPRAADAGRAGRRSDQDRPRCRRTVDRMIGLLTPAVVGSVLLAS